MHCGLGCFGLRLLSALPIAEKERLFGIALELSAEITDGSIGVFEALCDLCQGQLFDVSGSEGFVLAVNATLGCEEDRREVSHASIDSLQYSTTTITTMTNIQSPSAKKEDIPAYFSQYATTEAQTVRRQGEKWLLAAFYLAWVATQNLCLWRDHRYKYHNRTDTDERERTIQGRIPPKLHYKLSPAHSPW